MNWTEFSLQLQQFLSDNIGEIFAGFGGAFFGALAAYYFENRKETLKTAKDQHSALLVAQMTLIYQVNSLENIKRDLLDRFRETPNREVMMPIFHQAVTPLLVDFHSLSFLLSSADPNIVFELYLAERGFVNAIDSIKIRNVELEKFQATAEVSKFNPETGQAYVKADLVRVKILKDITDAMFDTVEKALTSLNQACDRLRKIAKKEFPKKKFISFEKESTVEPKK